MCPFAALGKAADIDRVMGPGLRGGAGLVGGGIWPDGQAAGLQTPGLWLQVPGCAQVSAVLVVKPSNKYRRPCGLMDKALVLGTKDCRFESCQGQTRGTTGGVTPGAPR